MYADIILNPQVIKNQYFIHYYNNYCMHLHESMVKCLQYYKLTITVFDIPDPGLLAGKELSEKIGRTGMAPIPLKAIVSVSSEVSP